MIHRFRSSRKLVLCNYIPLLQNIKGLTSNILLHFFYFYPNEENKRYHNTLHNYIKLWSKESQLAWIRLLLFRLLTLGKEVFKLHCSCKLFLLFERFLLGYFIQKCSLRCKNSVNKYKVLLMKWNTDKQNIVCLRL